MRKSTPITIPSPWFTGLLLLLSLQAAWAQVGQGTISGQVLTNQGQPLPGIHVGLEGTTLGDATDGQGKYTLPAVPAGDYTLLVSGIGYTTARQPVVVKADETVRLDIRLNEGTRQLNEVVVAGKTEMQQIRQQAFTVSAIDAKVFQNTTSDLNQVLNRTAGVRVREDGGLGSTFNFSLNGFSGRQVKFFLDGIPMDNFGSSLTLNNLPVNLARRIEVYKGVVPVWLGSDALGGAVNIVTNQSQRNFLDVSYSYGSFNTHRSSISIGYTHAKTGFTVLTNAFHNYSDNSYRVDVQIPDPETGRYGNPQRVRRFHDTYQSKTLQLETGFTNKKWADRLLLGIILSDNKKDIQTAALMERVYGQRFQTSTTVMPTLKYRKRDLLVKGLDLMLYGGYNLGQTQNVDTSARTYDWSGNYTLKPDPTAGEETRTLYTFQNNLSVATANVGYEISPAHALAFNYTFSGFNRRGSDAIRPNEESFRQPQQLNKSVIGLAYKFDLNGKWATSLFLKQYLLNGLTTVRAGIYTDKPYYEPLRSRFANPGYGVASTYYLTKDVQVKASFENTYRMPEGEEMFGDGVNVVSNPNLKPEQSQNINAGLLFGKLLNQKHRLSLETNLIYRDATDFIRQQVSGNRVQSINVRDVRNTGFDADVRYGYKQRFSVGLNATYQHLINRTKFETPGSPVVSTVYLDQIPNIPYLFGNADATVFFRNPGASDAVLSVGYTLNYVHEYYLRWPSLGARSTKDVIPQQVAHNVSATYSLKNGRYNATLECRNLADSKLYDNFLLQKPGRSVSVKLRYFINR